MKYVTSVGKARFNNKSVDLYTTKKGAVLVMNCLGTDYPEKTWRSFDSEESAREFIDLICGDADGVLRVKLMLDELEGRNFENAISDSIERANVAAIACGTCKKAE